MRQDLARSAADLTDARRGAPPRSVGDSTICGWPAQRSMRAMKEPA
jgi:hypothetical protein